MSIQDATIDFDNPRSRAGLFSELSTMRGKHRVTVIRFRPRRSDRQNRYYWPIFVHSLGEYLRDQGENILDDEVHELMKAKFLRRAVKHPDTGETIGFAIPSTTTLNTVEFNDYLDRCAHWLNTMFGIIVPEPNVYHERDGQ